MTAELTTFYAGTVSALLQLSGAMLAKTFRGETGLPCRRCELRISLHQYVVLFDYIPILHKGRRISCMAYDFETLEQAEVFVARVRGDRHHHFEDNFRDLWKFWSEVAAAMKQRGLHRLLAVISARGTLRSLDVATFYRRLGEMGFMANMRLAVVLDVPEYDRPVLRLGIGAAAQDGWTIRQFMLESDAMEWLEG